MNKLTDLKARNIKTSNRPIADGIITGLSDFTEATVQIEIDNMEDET